MRSSKELTDLFFKDLKTFNQTNFKTIAKADLTKQDAVVHKSFSSVITRYFIFREKHPEVSETEHMILYFKLKLDMIARYFSEYPDTTIDNLVAFQLELKQFMKDHKMRVYDEEEDDHAEESSISDIELESDNGMPVEQQPESLSVAV